LIEDVDRDSDAYNRVFAAFKMPKETDEEKQAILNDIIFVSAVMSKADTEKDVGILTDEFIKNYPETTEA
jgi:formiminotetrahydrofolate cyclodeaminase